MVRTERPAILIDMEIVSAWFGKENMFEKDYILRMIQEMVRMLLKLLFHIDSASSLELALREEENKEETAAIWCLLKDKQINEAENLLISLLDTGEMKDLKTALLFYDYLNGLSDQELEEASFTRLEVKEGVENALRKLGYEELLQSLPMDTESF